MAKSDLGTWSLALGAGALAMYLGDPAHGRHRGHPHRGVPDGLLALSYLPPGGVLGHWIARLFGSDPKCELDADLMRVKNMIETGRTAHDAARPASERRSAGFDPAVVAREPLSSGG